MSSLMVNFHILLKGFGLEKIQQLLSFWGRLKDLLFAGIMDAGILYTTIRPKRLSFYKFVYVVITIYL